MDVEDELSLWEENNIQIKENKVLRKAFQHMKADVSEFRILNNELRLNLYKLPIAV
jgi:Zn ribbon nucleic-acid-binding protein